MSRTRRKIQPVRTELKTSKMTVIQNANLKPYSSSVLAAIFIILCLQLNLAEAACPTIFFAQAIGHAKVASMDFYYTKTGVSTAAECANFCGLRQFCRTAAYNHDARTCALSYELVIECSTIKQRYNTFHLTTDGADSLSVVTCIDPCRKSFVGDTVNSNENPKTLFSILGKTDTVEKVPAKSTLKEAIILNTNPSSSNLNQPKMAKDSNGTSSFQTHGNGADPNLEIIQRLASGHIQMEDPRLNGFLNAIQQLHKINHELIQKEQDGSSKKSSEPNSSKKTVTFNGMPLHMQEYFNGATNAQQAEENHLKETASQGSSDVIRTFFNGTERKVHTGGLFKWLKPGESIVIAPPELVNTGNGVSNKLFEAKWIWSSNEILLKKKSEELRVAYEAGEPIVINGHILSSKEVQDLVSREKTSSTTTTTVSPWHPAGLIGEESAASVEREIGASLEDKKKKTAHTALQDDQGFLNTFVMEGLNDIMKDHSTSTTTTTSNPSTTTTTTTTTSKVPIVCYRYLPQQRLLYAEFRKGRGVTLNECRCACAETWRNSSTTSNQSDKRANLCKIDYHYVSCDIHHLISTAAKMCSKSADEKPKETAKESSKTTFSKSTTTATTTVEPTTAEQTEPTTTFTTTKKTSSSKAPSIEQQSAKAHGTTLRKEKMSKSKESENFNKLIKEEEQEMLNKEETNILIAETTTAPPRLFNRKTIKTNLTESSSMLVSSRPIKMAELTTISLSEMITPALTTTTSKPKPKTTTSKPKPKTTTSQPKPSTTQSAAVLNAKLNGCFEIIEGYTMNNTAGGLERDVSMEECQCFCANSFHSTSSNSGEFLSLQLDSCIEINVSLMPRSSSSIPEPIVVVDIVEIRSVGQSQLHMKSQSGG
uniref:Apple domain-containing protein n=1 Tax=Ditylenchus dipsaci TaxID=166011 RepID=A0A915CPG8_9BILA